MRLNRMYPIGNCITLVLLLSALVTALPAQDPAASAFPGLDRLPAVKELPDPFQLNAGRRASSAKEWAARREEIKALVLHYEYGHPAPAVEVSAAPVSAGNPDMSAGGEREFLLSLGPEKKIVYRLILNIPAGPGPFPVLIKGDLCWGRIAPPMIEAAVKRGYVVAEFDRTAIAPDNADRTRGVHALYPQYDWATLSAWAWGYHRTVDFLIRQPFVDAKRIGVTGHSRGGKAALLAGALDERIALTAPNGSGAGGAGCYRVQGEKSEDIGAITNRFGYWFHPRLKDFVGRVEQLPFDQHFLRALVAPRALLSTEALGDLWANPSGSQASFLAGREVFKFLGVEGRTGIHFREGKHEQNAVDWNALLDFADLQFFGKKTGTRFDSLPFSLEPAAFSWSAPAR